MTKQELIALLKSRMVGAKYPDYDGGWDSALENVIETLEKNKIEDIGAVQPTGDV